jgi:hypothetical protein
MFEHHFVETKVVCKPTVNNVGRETDWGTRVLSVFDFNKLKY